MANLKTILTAATIAAGAILSATQANALVYNPFNAFGSTQQVAAVTPGYIGSWWIEDGTAGVSPTGQSPADIRAMVELPAVTGLTVTDNGCREGLGGTGQNNGTNSKCTGNLFAIKTNDDGYLVFLYASALAIDDFSITLLSTAGLSRMDVFNTTQVSAVPVPGALVLLASGLAGLGALGRKKRKA